MAGNKERPAVKQRNKEIEKYGFNPNRVCMIHTLIPIVFVSLLTTAVAAAGYYFKKIRPLRESYELTIGSSRNYPNQQIKSPRADLCTLDSISSQEGRMECENVCKRARCCYMEGEKCSRRKQRLCNNEKYEPCMILGITDEIKQKKNKIKKQNGEKAPDDESIINAEKIYQACHEDSLTIIHQKRLCSRLCMPGRCCFKDDEKCPSDVDKFEFCWPYANCEYFFSMYSTLSIQALEKLDDDQDEDFYYDVEEYYDSLEEDGNV